MIQVFDNEAQANAVQPPKFVWHDLGVLRVYTGADIPVRDSIISTQQFRDRFTDPEKLAFLAAADGGDVNVKLLRLKLETNIDGLDLSSGEVIGGVNYLKSIGVLTAPRATEILRGA